jgi:hypothetical protein
VKVDALASLACTGPAIFDARQSLAIEVNGTFRACAPAQHLCVKDSDHEKYSESEKQPPRRESIEMEAEPGGDQRCNHQEKTDIAKAAVHSFKVRDLPLTGLLELFILLGWGGVGRRHTAIIAQRLLPVERGDRGNSSDAD